MKVAETSELNTLIAMRVANLRTARRYSLDNLAERSGVSRSMISLIERGEANPTAVILDKLAAALDVNLPTLFETEQEEDDTSPIVRRSGQHEWHDPASGYIRRNLTPPSAAQHVRLVEVRFPAGARVAFDHPMREHHDHQQVWILQGMMHITVGGKLYELREGDCLAMTLDQPVMFNNPGKREARYMLAISGPVNTKY